MERTRDLTHRTQVVRDCGPAEHGYRAECTCDWAGDWTPDELVAVLDQNDHHEVTDEVDQGDDVLNGLLDLQDDLSEVVVWLADHWTAALPAPMVHGRHPGADGTVLDVVVYCGDRATVDHIAGLLDVDVTASRTRWVARRIFGRVLVEATAGIPRVERPPGTGVDGHASAEQAFTHYVAHLDTNEPAS